MWRRWRSVKATRRKIIARLVKDLSRRSARMHHNSALGADRRTNSLRPNLPDATGPWSHPAAQGQYKTADRGTLPVRGGSRHSAGCSSRSIHSTGLCKPQDPVDHRDGTGPVERHGAGCPTRGRRWCGAPVWRAQDARSRACMLRFPEGPNGVGCRRHHKCGESRLALSAGRRRQRVRNDQRRDP